MSKFITLKFTSRESVLTILAFVVAFLPFSVKKTVELKTFEDLIDVKIAKQY